MAETNMTHEIKVLSGTGQIFLCDREVVDVDTAWVEYFMTTKDSLNITQNFGDASEIFVDQKTAPVASVTGEGTFDITFSVPSVDSVVLGLFFDTATPTYSPVGKTAISVGTTLKVVNKMMKINFPNESETIFTNVDLTGVVSKSSDGAFSVDVTGKVLAAGGAGLEEKEIIFYHKN